MTDGIRWDIPEVPRRGVHKIESLESSLHSVMANGALDRKVVVAQQLKDIWEQIAPEDVLSHTGSVFVEESTGRRVLVVLLDSPMLAADLNSRSILLLMKVNQLVESERNLRPFDAITFKVSRRAVNNSSFKKESHQTPSYCEKATPISLTQEEEKNIDEILICIVDEKLRERMKSAMVAHFEWKKGIDASK